MFTLSSPTHGAICFSAHHPKTSCLLPGHYIPGSRAYESRNAFGDFLYQHAGCRQYSICRSIYAPQENLTIRVQQNSPWLGFRVMLKKHMLHHAGAQKIKLLQGQVVFVHIPASGCVFYLAKGNVYEMFDMQVRPALLRNLETGNEAFTQFLHNTNKKNPQRLGSGPVWAGAMLLDLVDQLCEYPGNEAAAEELAKQVVILLTGKREHQRPLTEQQVENLFVVREQMKKAFAQRAQPRQWAAMAHMNITYFKSMFRQVFAITPYRYLLYERVKAAKEIISNEPGIGSTEVAHRCGFSSYTHFRRAFASLENKTLAQWRNNPDFLSVIVLWRMLLEDIII